MSTAGIRRAAIAAALLGLGLGCFSGEQRASEHSQQARAHLVAGNLESAMIELHSALKAAPDARWGNRCMDVAAPDGRRWLFLALSWEEDNEHPNIDMVIDASDAGRTAVGFLDTQDGTFHEAQLILRPGQGAASPKTGQ